MQFVVYKKCSNLQQLSILQERDFGSLEGSSYKAFVQEAEEYFKAKGWEYTGLDSAFTYRPLFAESLEEVKGRGVQFFKVKNEKELHYLVIIKLTIYSNITLLADEYNMF